MSDDLKRRFEELIAYIEETNAKVLNGEIHTLTDLEQAVEALCKETLEADAEMAKEMQPLMGETVSKLDELANNLIAFKKRHNSEDQT